MHKGRLLLPVLAALAAAGCARQQQAYITDPSTGRPVLVVMQQQTASPQYGQPQYAQTQYAQPQYAQPQYALAQYAPQSYPQPAPQAVSGGGQGLFNTRQSAPQPRYTQPTYTQQLYQPPALASGRGLLTSPQNAPEAYAYQPPPQPYVAQYAAPQYAAPRTVATYAPAPNAFASASLY
jgi:hypothetical protein